jgi:hypothetical protein
MFVSECCLFWGGEDELTGELEVCVREGDVALCCF